MLDILIFLPILIFSVLLHEVAHGLVALTQGDDTAYRMGRLTLNPLPHLDPIGSVVFPVICMLAHMPVFGWARPVPVNPLRFNSYRSGTILVSLAGPLTNILIACFFTGALYFATQTQYLATQYTFLPKFLNQAIVLNLVLAVFNLFPLPPLDGSRVLSAILPAELAQKYDAIESYGFYIIMGLIAFGIIGRVLSPIVSILYSLLLKIAGIY